MNGLEELNERALLAAEVTSPGANGEVVPAIKIDDLPQQGHFLHTARDQILHFVHDLADRSTSLRAPGPRDDTKCAMHVATLHDRNERGRLSRFQLVIADRLRR